ncbi:MAG: TolC family protein, partial [Armatimonadetes bacterium]|nr:TolC family protein [Armatimonadota bacterium]
MKQILIIGTLGLSSFALGQSLTLNHAVEKAFSNRPSLKSAQLKVNSARNAARALGAFPSTQLGVGHSTKADIGATDMDLYISQSLDIFGRSQSNRKIGEAEVHKAEAQLRQTKLDIQSSVVTQYFEAVAATKVRAYAESLRDLSQSLLQATQRRFEEGKIPEVQVTRARLEFERSQQTLLLRESQLQAALTRLRGVIGEVVTLEDIDVTTSLAPNPQVQLDQRPDIQILLAELEAAQAKSRAAQKSILPELEL